MLRSLVVYKQKTAYEMLRSLVGSKQKTAYEMLRSLVGSEMCIRDRPPRFEPAHPVPGQAMALAPAPQRPTPVPRNLLAECRHGVDVACLLYTSDAADEEDSVDLGGRRIIKKKKKKET